MSHQLKIFRILVGFMCFHRSTKTATAYGTGDNCLNLSMGDAAWLHRRRRWRRRNRQAHLNIRNSAEISDNRSGVLYSNSVKIIPECIVTIGTQLT